MICVPSTDTVAGQDDYASNPLFAVVDCNWVINPDTLKVQVTAIDGITGNFERSNPEKYVGVMQMTPWHYYDEKETTYLHGVTDHFEEGHDYCAPIPEAVRIDGIVSPWVVHSKYMATLVNDKLTACAGYIAKTHPTVSRGTVYRNLNLLSEDREILRVEVTGGPDHFDHNVMPHYHVSCVTCGKAFDVDIELLPDLLKQIRDKKGFKYLSYDVLFKGICPDCQETDIDCD